MEAHNGELSQAEAADQLADGATRSLSPSRYRTAFALFQAAGGLTIGGVFVVARSNLHWSVNLAIMVAFGALLILPYEYLKNRAGALPLRFTRLNFIGVIGSVAVALFAVLPYLNSRDQDGPVSLGVELVGLLVIAIPCCVVAVLIRRGRG